MTIQLFRLPQVVLTEVVKLLNPTEIFLLSLCSRKAFHTLQLHIMKSRQLNIHIEICHDETSITYKDNGSDGIFMKIEPDDYSAKSGVQRVKIGLYVPIEQKVGVWQTYGHCIDLGSKLVLTHIIGLFQRELYHVELNSLRFWIVDFLRNRQTVLPYFYHSDSWAPGLSFFNMLALKVQHFESKNFLHASFSSNFKGFGAQQTVRLGDSRYLKIEDLMKMDQLEITLAYCNFTSSDVNLFLKHWMIDGGSPRLRLLRIAIRQRQLFRMEEVLRGLEKYMVKGDGITKEYISLRAEDPRQNTNRAHYRTTSNQELRRPDGGTVIVRWDNELTLLFFPPKP